MRDVPPRADAGRTTAVVYLMLAAATVVLPFAWLRPVLACASCKGSFWLAHSEGQSLVTSGKFSGAYYATDAFSGELPVYYNMLSPSLMNTLADLLDMPAVEFQALVWGPLMVVLLLWATFLSIRVLTGDAIVALVAALLTVGLADGAFIDALYRLSELNPAQAKNTMHVPAVAQGLGTDQTFGWVLFLPCLVALHEALSRRSAALFALAGALFGILLKAHTLTLINVATIASVYVFAHNIVLPQFAGDHSSGLRLRTALFAAAVAVLLLHGRAGTFGPVHFLLLWVACWGLALRGRGDVVQASAFAAAAAAVAGDYLWHLYTLRDSLAALDVQTSSVSVMVIAVFFAPLIAAALLLATGTGSTAGTGSAERRGLALAVIASAVTLVLSQGAAFGLTNHPYRYAINLVFPLAVLAAIAVAHRPAPDVPRLRRTVTFALQAWLCLSVAKVLVALTGIAPSAAAVLGETRAHNRFTVPSQGRRAVLARLRELTAGGQARLLLAPEHNYPKASAASGVLLSYASAPAFLPDERYVLWKDQIARRLAIFCAMFPDYPHRSPGAATANGSCRPWTGSATPRLVPADRATAADIAPVYGLDYAVDLDGKFATLLEQQAPIFGWQPLLRQGRDVLYKITAPPASSGRLAFGAARSEPALWSIPFTAPAAGRYHIFGEGTGAAAAIVAASHGTMPLAIERHGPDIVVVIADLAAGTGILDIRLAPDASRGRLPPVPLHYLTGVPAASSGTVRIANP